jgi:hypothetical protein
MPPCSAARAIGAALVLAPALLLAQTSTKVVTLGGHQVTMTAKSLVVAADNINDARHSTPISPAYNGVGAISITSNLGSFLCTGSLLADGKTVLTAAHCLTGDIGTVTKIQMVFYPPSGGVILDGASWTANPNYSGSVIDENDIGVIHLTAEAPADISRYDIATTSAENDPFRFVGFGQRGSFGQGVSLGAGFALGNRKAGENLFDIHLGDPRWDGFWNDPNASTANVLLADFDNGLQANDGMCWIGQFIPDLGTSECNLGLGVNEADTGGGDSGGPRFVNGKIASITSFGLTFGSVVQICGELKPRCFVPGPDIDNFLNSSFGEFAGFTDVAFQHQWIEDQLDLSNFDPISPGPDTVVPEPGTNVLLATGLIGVVGIVRRRRRMS